MGEGANTRVLVVGCGGIGGVIATALHSKSCDLTIATTNEAVRRAWREHGPTLDGAPGAPPISPERLVSSASEAGGGFDVVLIAVQPTQLEAAAHSLTGHLNQDARVVCLPNGLSEDRLAKVLGPETVVGAVVSWGARMPHPGSYTKTSEGGFQLGSLSGRPDAQLDRVEAVLEIVAPVTRTDNLRGARYTKLAINCAVSTLGTIGGTTLGELLLRSDVRHLALDILAEGVHVARAEKIKLEPVAGLDLSRLVPPSDQRTSPLHTAAQHAVLLALGARYRNLRSSMLAAIERGRSPSVDYLNGEIVERGKAYDIHTPVNEAAQRTVWEIAQGKRAAGIMALRRVRDLANLLETRA